MAFDHLDAAARLEGIPPAPKSVLVHLSQPACEVCGLTWAGLAWLERKTGLGRTAISSALEYLVRDGHLTIHAYPKGGRGRSTEYVVLPAIVKLSTPACGKCRANMKTGRHAVGIDNSETEKPTASRSVSGKPTAETPQNLPPGGHQSVRESESVSALRAQQPAEAPPAPASDPHPPQTAQDAIRRLWPDP
jgi:hypothetical protein